MKITDFALIFVGITLPLIIIVYVNVSFSIKAFEQEMYYQKVINAAIQDSLTAMKEVESQDPENDYGYSGEIDNKISVNAEVAKNAFFESLYNTFNIQNNKASQSYLQLYIPVVAIIDYNGIYVSSIQEYDKNGTNVEEHVLKPKRYYSYTYMIDKDGNYIDEKGIYNKDGSYTEIDGLAKMEELKINKANYKSINYIEFTMDDRITHSGIYNEAGVLKSYPLKTFYIADSKNNGNLFYIGAIDKDKDKIVEILKSRREEIIVEVVTKELAYAVNNNNIYAKARGISYTFTFPQIPKEEMYRYIENTGVISFVQGLKVGNKYLNYKAYGGSDLTLRKKYYMSIPKISSSRFSYNLYHKTQECPEYKASVTTGLVPGSTFYKGQAASSLVKYDNKEYTGFYACPICNP